MNKGWKQPSFIMKHLNKAENKLYAIRFRSICFAFKKDTRKPSKRHLSVDIKWKAACAGWRRDELAYMRKYKK